MTGDPGEPLGGDPLTNWNRRMYRWVKTMMVTQITGAKRKPQPNGGVIYELPVAAMRGSGAAAPTTPTSIVQLYFQKELGPVASTGIPTAADINQGAGSAVLASKKPGPYDATNNPFYVVAKPYFLARSYYIQATFADIDGNHTYSYVSKNQRNDTLSSGATVVQSIEPPYSTILPLLCFLTATSGTPSPVDPSNLPAIVPISYQDMNVDNRRWRAVIGLCASGQSLPWDSGFPFTYTAPTS